MKNDELFSIYLTFHMSRHVTLISWISEFWQIFKNIFKKKNPQKWIPKAGKPLYERAGQTGAENLKITIKKNPNFAKFKPQCPNFWKASLRIDNVPWKRTAQMKSKTLIND